VIITKFLIDNYFTLDNPWFQVLEETGTVKEKPDELIHRMIRKIEIFPNKSIKITFAYEDCFAPLIACMDALQQENTQ
jgi:hypothetical protein